VASTGELNGMHDLRSTTGGNMDQHRGHEMHDKSLNAMALMATRHCLTGCAIGEVLGMVIGTSLGWHTAGTVAISVFLAFVFGYALTLFPLVRGGMTLAAAIPVTFAVDTLSITVMEIVDNLIMLAIPGAMHAGVGDWFFWVSLAVALAVAGVAAFPVNRWLIQKGRGHALLSHEHADRD
jgi:hypothetical protein